MIRAEDRKEKIENGLGAVVRVWVLLGGAVEILHRGLLRMTVSFWGWGDGGTEEGFLTSRISFEMTWIFCADARDPAIFRF